MHAARRILRYPGGTGDPERNDHPAHEIGQDAEIGSIAVGKLADFVVCDAALNRSAVYLGGQAL